MLHVAARKVFPEVSLIQALGDFWDQQMGTVPANSDEIFSLGSEMDSLTAVVVLVEVSGQLPDVPLNESLIKKGGYKAKAEFVPHLMSGIKAEAEKHGY